MAQLLLIKTDSLSARDNRENGDLIGVFEDGHIFTPHEQKIFNVVKIKGTREQVEAAFPVVETREAVKDERETTWSLKDDSQLAEEQLTKTEVKTVWDDAGDWKEVKVQPRFDLRHDVTVKENYSRYLENKETTLISKDAESREA